MHTYPIPVVSYYPAAAAAAPAADPYLAAVSATAAATDAQATSADARDAGIGARRGDAVVQRVQKKPNTTNKPEGWFKSVSTPAASKKVISAFRIETDSLGEEASVCLPSSTGLALAPLPSAALAAAAAAGECWGQRRQHARSTDSLRRQLVPSLPKTASLAFLNATALMHNQTNNQ